MTSHVHHRQRLGRSKQSKLHPLKRERYAHRPKLKAIFLSDQPTKRPPPSFSSHTWYICYKVNSFTSLKRIQFTKLTQTKFDGNKRKKEKERVSPCTLCLTTTKLPTLQDVARMLRQLRDRWRVSRIVVVTSQWA